MGQPQRSPRSRTSQSLLLRRGWTTRCLKGETHIPINFILSPHNHSQKCQTTPLSNQPCPSLHCPHYFATPDISLPLNLSNRFYHSLCKMPDGARGTNKPLLMLRWSCKQRQPFESPWCSPSEISPPNHPSLLLLNDNLPPSHLLPRHRPLNHCRFPLERPHPCSDLAHQSRLHHHYTSLLPLITPGQTPQLMNHDLRLQTPHRTRHNLTHTQEETGWSI